MRQSQLFTETIKEAPKNENSANARLLVRAGFVDKLMAGTYSYLPLGFRVFKKIENIIRTEMDRIGGQELLMPALHPKDIWQKTERWQYPEMFKMKNRQGKEFGLGWTHEEVITPLAKRFIKSYKNLPFAVYQIQDKFRDELRAKSGLLRGVEFFMKDLYSFHKDEKSLDNYYEKVKKAYFEVFRKCGLGKHTFLTLASGGAFSPYSHEFQTVTDFGEDDIYLCSKCKTAINKEIIEQEKYQCSKCKNKKLEVKKAIEVGNIFKLGNRFSKAFDLYFKNEQGKEKPVLMGCYGIGLGRLMGAVVEVYHDERGIIWPKEIAPFLVHLLEIKGRDPKVGKKAQELYGLLQKMGIEVLYDDRKDKAAGEKFAEADLIGIPSRMVVSQRTLEGDSVEIKQRSGKKIKLIKIKEIEKCLN